MSTNFSACKTLLSLKNDTSLSERNKQKARQRAKVINTKLVDTNHLEGITYMYTFSTPFLSDSYPVEKIYYKDRSNYILNFKMLIASFYLRQGNVSRLLKDYTSPEEKVIYQRCIWLTHKGFMRFLKEYIDKSEEGRRYVLFRAYSSDFIAFMREIAPIIF